MKRATNENKYRQIGLSLIELMISLAIGLIVVLAVTNIYISNRATFRTQEALAQVQQNARISFELLAHDVREAGFNPCGIPSSQVMNVLNDKAGKWWSNWAGGIIQGFENADDAGNQPVAKGTATNTRLVKTDAVIIRGTLPACDGKDMGIVKHVPASAEFETSSSPSCIASGDVLMACDPKQAAIFQATSSTAATKKITHIDGNTVSPGNCSKGLGNPTVCTAVGSSYTFESGGIISRLYAVYWFIGTNDRGGKSLFRARTVNNPAPQAISTLIEEIAEGVSDLQMEYLVRKGGVLAGAYVTANNVPAADWDSVVAVRATLDIESSKAQGTDGKPIKRTFVHLFSLRNREIVQ